jgi:RNA polymerase sigma-B factor
VSLEPDRRRELRQQFVAYAQSREPALREELVEAHLGLAEYLARRFANRGEALDDLIQVASLGLLKAVDRFDPDRDIEFSTYATYTIVGELKRHFRDKGWSVRAPRRMQELYLQLGKVVPALGQELGRSPTIAELAKSLRGRGPRGAGSGPGLPFGVPRRAGRQRRRRHDGRPSG